MNKKRFSENPFMFKWYRLDPLDVLCFQRFVVRNFKRLPDEFKQSILNLYNDLDSPRNPRNLKLLK